jgi:hypothetical protein
MGFLFRDKPQTYAPPPTPPTPTMLGQANAAERAGLAWGGMLSPYDPVHFYFDPMPGQDRTELINNFGEQVRRLQSRQ